MLLFILIENWLYSYYLTFGLESNYYLIFNLIILETLFYNTVVFDVLANFMYFINIWFVLNIYLENERTYLVH